jgi:hypothetical protein
MLAARTRRTVVALVVAAGLTLLVVPATAQNPAAQAAQVAGSSGTAEALIPDVGWRQAVLGRVLPVGSILTCWIDSSVEVEVGSAAFVLQSLSHAEIASVSEQQIELRLSAGALDVTTEGTEVLIRLASIGGGTAGESTMVVLVEGEARVTTTAVMLTSGSARVNMSGEEAVELAAGDQFSPAAPPLEPVFR